MAQIIPICPFLLEADSSSKIMFSHMVVADSYPLHSHDYYEMELVLRGEGRQWLNNAAMPLTKGSLYICSLSDVHRLEADSPLHILSIHFLPDTLKQFNLPDIHNAYSLHLSEKEFDLYYSLSYTLIEHNNHDIAYKEQQMLSITMLLLIHLLRNGTKDTSSLMGSRLQNALKYIQTNYSNPNLRLKDAADICHLSSCHFSTLFHNVVGCGFSEYLTKYRMQNACTLLITQDMSVTEIAYEVGFSSLAHFFRVFKKTYQCTPKEYRERHLTDSTLILQTPLWGTSVIPAQRGIEIR